MSASKIPNLNSLRRGGGSARGRFRGRGSTEAPAQQADLPPHHDQQLQRGKKLASDKIVQGTDNDASISRASAVELGYLEDPFANALTPPAGLGTRRYPIINRGKRADTDTVLGKSQKATFAHLRSWNIGTYARTVAIDRLVNDFLNDDNGREQPPRKKQIISLGAGSDTRAFRLFASRASSSLVYHELDFPVNTTAKIKAIRASPLLRRTLGLIDSGESDTIISATGDALHSPFYHIHPIDLRVLVPSESQTGKGEGFLSDTDIKGLLPGIDSKYPTILLSECCLVYLPPEEAVGVVDFFTKHLFHTFSSDSPPLGLILYEPIRPEDPFGKTMVSNLATRGIQLQTLHRYASLEAQKQRLNEHGFKDGQGAADIDFIWQHWVNEAEKERVAALEMLDEIEEWRLLAQHYCVAWGWSEHDKTGDTKVFEGWKYVESQLES